MKLLKRLVTEIREENPALFCLSVKLNSRDYIKARGLSRDEALEQVAYMISCKFLGVMQSNGIRDCIILLPHSR
jgi:2,4-dienoyl-CoA reductase-like NADH-dependent reductase (Old Yellow Enzyme family)